MDVEKLKLINDKIEDEESKDIFGRRLLYSLTGDASYITVLGERFKASFLNDNRWKDFVNKIKSCKKERGIVAYGSMGYGRMLVSLTKDVGWKYVIDKCNVEEKIYGIKVIKTDEYIELNSEEYIVISSMRYFEEMKSYLIGSGVDEKRIIDGTILWELTEGRQYFDVDFLPHDLSGEVFIDAGACDGMSSVQFMKWCEGRGDVICFEPDLRNVEGLKRNLKDKGFVPNRDYQLIEKGVWSETTTLSFTGSGGADSHIVSEAGIEPDVVSISVVAIDDCMNNRKATFIKMDIEGAELEALYGAAQTIREYKPKLAICVYHKPEDIWTIPSYVLELRKDYKLYFRHYSFGQTETVMYAI